MRVYKYINGRCYVADAPDDAHPIYLGPQAEIDLVITAINWAKAYARVQDPKTKREVVSAGEPPLVQTPRQ